MGQEQSAALKRLLQPGELLLWEGAPVPGFRLEPAEWFLMPFSLLWCGFACYWEVAALQNGASGIMALFGIPFLLVGLYLVTGRFFHMAWRRKRTYYGVTSMRVILIGPKTTKFLTYRQIPALENESAPTAAARFISPSPRWFPAAALTAGLPKAGTLCGTLPMQSGSIV